MSLLEEAAAVIFADRDGGVVDPEGGAGDGGELLAVDDVGAVAADKALGRQALLEAFEGLAHHQAMLGEVDKGVVVVSLEVFDVG